MTLGKEYVEVRYKQQERKLEDVEIEREIIIEMSCSSEDDDGKTVSDSRSRRSGNINLNRSLLSRNNSETPMKFRKRAKTRLDVSARRFMVTEMNSNQNEKGKGKDAIKSGEVALNTNYSKFNSLVSRL